MPRALTPTILVLFALVLTGCKANKVDYQRSYNLAPDEERAFRISGDGVRTSIYNTGAAELSVNGASTDGLLTWERPNIQPGSKEYTMMTTTMVDIEVRNLTSFPGSFTINTVGKGEVVVVEHP